MSQTLVFIDLTDAERAQIDGALPVLGLHFGSLINRSFNKR